MSKDLEWRFREKCVELMSRCESLSQAAEIRSRIRRLYGDGDIFMQNKLIEMYGKCGCVELARQIFDAMPVLDCFSWGLMICAYTRNDELGDAKVVFDSMPRDAQNLISWTALINAFALEGKMETSKDLFDRMPLVNLVSWNSLLNGYANSGSVLQTENIFEKMPEKDLLSWTSMLVAYTQAGHFDLALKTFRYMPERDLVAYNTILVVYCRYKALERAICFFGKLPELNLVSWNAMIAAYAAAGHLDMARQTMENMPQRCLLCCNTLLTAYFAREVSCKVPQSTIVSTFTHSGRLEEAKCFFDGMPSQSSVSWTNLLIIYGQNGQVEHAKSVFDGMPEKDLVAWTSMLGILVQSFRFIEARLLFDSMPEKDVVAWNTMLAGYIQAGMTIEANELFDRMPEKNATAWNCMLGMYAERGHLGSTRKIFEVIPADDRGLVSWYSLLTAYCRQGHSDQGFETFHSMEMVAESPDELCFTLLLVACGFQGEVYTGRCIFASMSVDYGVEAGKHHYACMVDLLSRAGHLESARELIGSMPFVDDTVDWVSLLGSCKRFNNLELGTLAARMILKLETRHGATYVLLASVFTSKWNTIYTSRTQCCENIHVLESV